MPLEEGDILKFEGGRMTAVDAVPMSKISAPVKEVIDEYTALDLEQYRDKLTTSNATPTLLRSVPIPVNSIVFVDVIVTFLNTATFLAGGYIWATWSFSRTSGAPVSLGTIDILGSWNLTGSSVSMVPNAVSNNVDIFITGRISTTLSWSAHTKIDRGNP